MGHECPIRIKARSGLKSANQTLANTGRSNQASHGNSGSGNGRGSIAQRRNIDVVINKLTHGRSDSIGEVGRCRGNQGRKNQELSFHENTLNCREEIEPDY